MVQPAFGSFPSQFASWPLLAWTSLAAVAVIAAAGLLCWRPHLWLRLLFRTIYRLQVFGRENVLASGPALLVCNHVSYLEALLLLAAQNRPIRFVVWAPLPRVPGLRLLLRLLRAVVIDSTAGPRAIVGSLRAASEALAHGEVVCVFTEDGGTRTGFVLPFDRGLAQILKRSPAPVIPLRLDHVWGCLLSQRSGKLSWKWPQRLPYPVCVAFGPPLPPAASAFQVLQAMQKLSADAAIARAEQQLPVHRQFVRMAARHPWRPCWIDSMNQGKVWRYGAVLAGASLLARWLRPRLEDDTMVGLWLPPSAGGALANIALAFLSKTSVNLNYTSSANIVQGAIRQCHIRRVLTSRTFTAKVALDAPGVELIYLEDFRRQVSSWQRLRAFLAALVLPGFVLDRWVLRLAGHRPNDLATVIFSSGSTGDPKGVMLTHRNLSANVESVVQAIDLQATDRVLGILPFFHSFGYTVTLWLPLQVAMSTVYHPNPLQAKEIGELCRSQRCTIVLATPTFLRSYLKRCQAGDFDSVRVLMCGAEKLPQKLAGDFQTRFGILPLEGYGCTELSPVAAANVPDWQAGGARHLAHKPGTIGQPVPGVAAKIVDPQSFEPVEQGMEGLLLIYGANVMKGYLGRPEATREVIRDGWYVTGDMAKFDLEGFITITGRLARFSKIGGEMVPHEKIEEELHAILGTSERTWVVTAVPDEKRGERLIVMHTPLKGAELHEIWTQLNNRGLPNLWIPAERDFFEIPKIPLLGTGKVDLQRIKDMALERTREALTAPASTV